MIAGLNWIHDECRETIEISSLKKHQLGEIMKKYLLIQNTDNTGYPITHSFIRHEVNAGSDEKAIKKLRPFMTLGNPEYYSLYCIEKEVKLT